MSIKTEKWATLPEGDSIYRFELANENGIKVNLINYGGIITSIITPDKDGNLGDIVLGYDNIDGYIADRSFFGAMIGRYANRIAGAKFSLGGNEYLLTPNERGNQLHGGSGYHKKLWGYDTDGDALILSLFSPDGEDGYPGNLDIKAKVSLDEMNRLTIEFTAVSDEDTIVNLTNHSYFNLACGGSILGHRLMIDADRYNPVGAGLIPTGELKPVEGTDFDFRSSRVVEKDNYDHNFVLNGGGAFDAEVYDPESGRVMRVSTNMPGLQFYCGGGLNGKAGKDGAVYNKNGALCLEPQYFPNTPNEPKFPSCVLKAGDMYNHKITYEFSISEK